MQILVVNDDSIAAPGISLLAKAAAELGEVTVVAPAHQCSAMSQKLTLREVLAVEKVEDFSVNVQGAYRLDGTPVDCVKVALDYILEDRPDYVFSGINNGYNVGFDIAYSGTLGAAFEAARHMESLQLHFLWPAITICLPSNPTFCLSYRNCWKRIWSGERSGM